MKEINHRLQIFKFGLYGLLKNLRFFEPFIIIHFINYGLSLFYIGILFSIRELTIYIFEIPSGVIADRYGKKFELYICFIFYILSFTLFFFATSFILFVLAMMLFGLGEAFRSGTHKSMIMAYLDIHKLNDSKTKVYGLTRSYSLIGSMIASLLSIVFVLWLPEIRYLFLLAMIPYVFEILLLISYPSYLNDRKDSDFSFSTFVRHNLNGVKYAFKEKPVRNAILNASSYQAGFKIIKDYIQPLIISLTLTVILFKSFSVDENAKIYIGVTYAFIYLVSAGASKYAYLTKKIGTSHSIVRFMWFISGISLIILSVFVDYLFAIFTIFLVLYVLMNLRRPIMVEVIGDVTDKKLRATILSIESQMTSLWIAILAPIIGLIADYSISLMLLSVGVMMCLIFVVQHTLPKKEVF